MAEPQSQSELDLLFIIIIDDVLLLFAFGLLSGSAWTWQTNDELAAGPRLVN